MLISLFISSHTMKSAYTTAPLFFLSLVFSHQSSSSLHSSNSEDIEVQEYCEWETFNATCHEDEVIVMAVARYGRMRLGRCVTKNYGHIGCGTDVTGDFDAACSGRRSCAVSVIALHSRMSCPKDFKSYLEASYECIKVSAASDCSMNGSVITDVMSGLLSSQSSSRLDAGHSNCPWTIVVKPYQTINITLIDYSIPAENSFSMEGIHNPGDVWGVDGEVVRGKEYAVITEGITGNETRIFSGATRQSWVYMSHASVIRVRFSAEGARESAYLLRFEAIGCPPLSPVQGSWIWSNGQQAVVHCNETDDQWTVNCYNGHWIGQLGNCSEIESIYVSRPVQEWSMDAMFANGGNFPYGILFVIALGVLIGVAAGVLMLLAVLTYMKRRRTRKIRSRSNYMIDEARHRSMLNSQDFNTNKYPILCPSGMMAAPSMYKPTQNSSYTPHREESLPTFRNLSGTWQRTRPLPTPNDSDDRDDVVAMTSLGAELPLLSSFTSSEGQMTHSPGGSSCYPTFGPGYHEQCINMLRQNHPYWHANNHRSHEPGDRRRVARGAEDHSEQGPYYFKLVGGDVSTVGGHNEGQQIEAALHQCVGRQTNNDNIVHDQHQSNVTQCNSIVC